MDVNLKLDTPKNRYNYDLTCDLNTPAINDLILDEIFAGELYAALCNMRWYKMPLEPIDRVVFKLMKGSPDNFSGSDCWSVSWRRAGTIVADLRNRAGVLVEETYMTWYCGGNEGFVSKRVGSILNGLGWHSVEWPEI